MAKRPKVFDQQHVEAELREQGVPEESISPTISFIRIVIPLLIRDVGAEGIVELLERTRSERGLSELSVWAKKMAPYIETWARTSLDAYFSQRDQENSF